MKVKIIKCSNPNYWYANDIGNTFKVQKELDENNHYICKDEVFLIYKDDCKIVDKKIKIKMNNSHDDVLGNKNGIEYKLADYDEYFELSLSIENSLTSSLIWKTKEEFEFIKPLLDYHNIVIKNKHE